MVFLRNGILLSLILLVGCATYSARVGEVRHEVADGDFDAALETLEKTRGDKAMLLYYLEKGLVLHYADRWQESNMYFQMAENLEADLYTKSISEGAISLITSDNSISYRAEPFEMAMVPYYRALNYVYLGQQVEAVVEARKASLYLQRYTDDLLAGGGETTTTRERLLILRYNAFLEYFSALIYEWGGEWNDAYISYQQAAQAYQQTQRFLDVQTPPWLGDDLVRTARGLGFVDELAELQRMYPKLWPAGPDTVQAESAPRGEIVLLFEFGYVDFKIQKDFTIPILETDRYETRDDWSNALVVRADPAWSAPEDSKIVYWLRIAMPELVEEPPAVNAARVSAGVGADHATTVQVEDVAGRSQIQFDSESGTILLKTILRALAKYATTKEAEKLDSTAGTVVNIFGAVTETADTRSWMTLPYDIGMVRLSLSPGVYDLQVDLVGQRGETVASRTIPGVEVRAGEWYFQSRRIFD